MGHGSAFVLWRDLSWTHMCAGFIAMLCLFEQKVAHSRLKGNRLVAWLQSSWMWWHRGLNPSSACNLPSLPPEAGRNWLLCSWLEFSERLMLMFQMSIGKGHQRP